MEKRIGVIAILLEATESVQTLNALLSSFGDIILGRQGLPLRDKGIHIISIIVEGHTDRIGALSGKIGKLPGVQVKSVLTRYKETDDEADTSGKGGTGLYRPREAQGSDPGERARPR